MSDRRRIDLSHLIQETADDRVEVVLGDETFLMPAKFPLGVAILMDRGKASEAAGLLVGADDVERFAPFFGESVIEGILAEVYGAEAGKSSDSSSASTTTGTP